MNDKNTASDDIAYVSESDLEIGWFKLNTENRCIAVLSKSYLGKDISEYSPLDNTTLFNKGLNFNPLGYYLVNDMWLSEEELNKNEWRD